jgi:hypothetical protein
VATFPELIPNASGDDNSPSQKYLVDYYTKMGDYLDQAYEEASAEQEDVPEIRQIGQALDYLMGMQWKESMPSYRAKPVTNEMLSNFWETIGLLSDLKPMFNISQTGGEGDYSHISSILNKCAKGWAVLNKFEYHMAFCIMFGMLTTAPAKIYWNPFARGDSGDPSDGDITFEAIPAKSFLRLGINKIDELNDDELCIYRRVRTLNWLKRAYPTMGKLVPPEQHRSKYTVDVQTPLNVMPTLFENLSPAAKRLVGAGEKSNQLSVFPKAECREFWLKDDSINDSRNKIWMGPRGAAWGYWVDPGKKMYPRGRLIIRANKVTLYDEPNPYFHRKRPFALLGLNAVPWQQYAMSVISPWMSQQDILNQLMAGVVQCVKKAINPALLASRQAISAEALRAIDASKPNLKISYNGMSGQVPTWQQPPNIPAYVMQTQDTIRRDMRRMSGSAAMDEALGKKQMAGGDTLDRITFSKTTPIRFMGRNLEYFIDEVGNLFIGTALQFYDAAKRSEMIGVKGLTREDLVPEAGSLLQKDIDSESFIRRFSNKSDKGTLLNVQRQDRIQISFALRKNKDLSREGLFRQLDWNIDTAQNDAELQKEAEMAAAAMAAAGVKPGAKKK